MKRQFAIILCVAVVAILIGVLASRGCGADTNAEPRAAGGSAPSHAYPAGHIDSLDYVKTPAGLTSREIDYEGFRLSFNADNATPNWVAWELLGSETDGPESRSSKFLCDENVAGCPSTGDYSNSGFDRGHMCPAADQKWSAQAMQDCFYLTNICPQNHSLNSGAWSTLEKKERLWAQRDSAIVIVAGPIYDPSDRNFIGRDTRVRVPGAFFKVMLAPYAAEPRAIAFIYPNMASPGNMENYVTTVDEVEQITGLDFFSSLPDDIENKVESRTSFNQWNRNP